MNTYSLPTLFKRASRIGYGCMRLGTGREASSGSEQAKAAVAIDAALEAGITLFDHADIYRHGASERLFGEYLRAHPDVRRRIVLQSKCGIRRADEPSPGLPARYDLSAPYLLAAVDGILERLGVDQLDILLLHRPDCLVEPDEVATAFDTLYRSGRVLAFGVSNHTAGQIELLKRSVQQPLIINQLELSLAHAAMIEEGITANTAAPLSRLASGTLDYCRLNDIRVQAWSPLGGARHAVVTRAVQQLGTPHGVSPEVLAIAWLLRHPAQIQPIIGSTDPDRIAQMKAADELSLSREDWYALFGAARGSPVP